MKNKNNNNVEAERQKFYADLRVALAKVNVDDLQPQSFVAPTRAQIEAELKRAYGIARPIILLGSALPGVGDKLKLIVQLFVRAADTYNALPPEGAEAVATDSTTPDFKAGKDL